MDYNGYTIAYDSLCCDDCDIELMPVVGQVSVSTILYVIGEHDKEAHDS